MDPRPSYRVGAAGLDPRDWRLIEIVFRHSQYNRYEFTLVEDLAATPVDILIVNTTDSAAVRVAAGVRASGRSVPIIAAVPRGAPSAARHAISIDRLTLQLLPILNRVVEMELSGRSDRPGGEPVSAQPSAPATAASPAVPPGRPAATTPPGAAAAAMPPSSMSSPAVPVTARPIPVPGAMLDVPDTREGDTVPAGDRSSAGSPPGEPPPAGVAQAAGAPVAGALPAAMAVPGEVSAAERSPPSGRAMPPPRGERDPARADGRSARPGDAVGTRPDERRPDGSPGEGRNPSNLVAFPSGAAVEPGRGQRLRVLVIDDSPTVRQQLTLAFERMGMVCDAAADAPAALARLAEQHFDLALVDVIMPDMDGYKLTREIKRNRRTRQIPVIILTSKSSPFDLARGALAGCDSFLSKPVPLKALEAAVVKHLRKSLAIDDLSSLLRPLAAPAPATETGRAGPPASGRAARKP